MSAYTDALVQAFVIGTVPVFDSSVKRRSIAPEKVFAVDTGLANRVVAQLLAQPGRPHR